MQEKSGEKRLPTGSAAGLEKDKETLPAIEVDNTVCWVNKDMQLPFKVEIGEQTQLGLFLTPALEQEGYPLEVVSKHGRSGVLGRIIFQDKDGNRYREIDIKGIGHAKKNPDYWHKGASQFIVGSIEDRANNAVAGYIEGNWGILDYAEAAKDAQLGEYFYNEGIRVVRSVATAKLNEIIDNKGNQMSVAKAKEEGIIHDAITPAIEVRAFTTRARISDRTERGGIFVEDARQLVAAELHRNSEEFSMRDYLEWFSNTLAEEMGKLHKLGYFHGYITPHNVTLDSRLMDFGSTSRFEDVTEESIETIKSRLALGLFGFKKDVTDTRELARMYDFSRAYMTIFAEFTESFELQNTEGKKFLEQLSDNFFKVYEKASGEKLQREETLRIQLEH